MHTNSSFTIYISCILNTVATLPTTKHLLCSGVKISTIIYLAKEFLSSINSSGGRKIEFKLHSLWPMIVCIFCIEKCEVYVGIWSIKITIYKTAASRRPSDGGKFAIPIFMWLLTLLFIQARNHYFYRTSSLLPVQSPSTCSQHNGL